MTTLNLHDHTRAARALIDALAADGRATADKLGELGTLITRAEAACAARLEHIDEAMGAELSRHAHALSQLALQRAQARDDCAAATGEALQQLRTIISTLAGTATVTQLKQAG